MHSKNYSFLLILSIILIATSTFIVSYITQRQISLKNKQSYEVNSISGNLSSKVQDNNFKDNFPQPYSKISWRPGRTEQITFMLGPGEYEDMQFVGSVSVPVKEEPVDFIMYYRIELDKEGWRETGTVNGDDHWSFWIKGEKYFVFGYQKAKNSNEYIPFFYSRE